MTVLAIALILAFVFVEVWPRIPYLKLFSRVKYVCGWFALLVALITSSPFWFAYLPAGLLIGSIYSLINKKY